MSGELTIEKRIGELQVNQHTVELKIGGAFALTPQYRVFSDRVTLNTDLSYKYFRVGMLAGVMIIHETLTALGFNGIINTDWKLTGTILSGTPGGLTTQLQFNDAGVFAGATGITWNKLTNTLTFDQVTEGHRGKIVNVVASDGNVSGTYPVNCSGYNDHIITIVGATVLSLSNITAGQGGVISMRIDAIGGYSVTLDPASFTTKVTGSDTIDTVANKKNLISWWYDGTYVFYSVSKEA